MNAHADSLNAWHLELGILADAFDVCRYIDNPDGQAATAHVLMARFRELLESCPFPEVTKEGGQP